MVSKVLLEAQNLTLGYDGVPVVRSLSFDLNAGEVLAMLGPNGAGKSTTLSACAGFITPMAGELLLEGRSIAGLPAHKASRLGIAHVPEGRGIFHSLTVAEHLRLCISAAAVEAALDHFPALRDLANRRAGLLSGGEQQMLALACALAREPRVLLIDELSMGLAPIIVERLMPVIRDYADTSGCAVILVEQYVHMALEVSDRAVVLSHGEAVLNGPADSLRHDRTLLMASYVGDSVLNNAGSEGTKGRHLALEP